MGYIMPTLQSTDLQLTNNTTTKKEHSQNMFPNLDFLDILFKIQHVFFRHFPANHLTIVLKSELKITRLPVFKTKVLQKHRFTCHLWHMATRLSLFSIKQQLVDPIRADRQ